MSEPPHNPDLNAVERALAGLTPSAGAFNRDALMFTAGRASVRRGWGWPCATAGSTLAVLILGALLLFRPTPEPVVHVVFLNSPQVEKTPSPPEAPAPPDEAPPPGSTGPLRPETNYLTLRHQVERWGEAGLPNVPSPAADQKPAAPDLLDLPPDLRTDPWLQRRAAMLTSGGPL
jgi:hypothetical protein